jgi:hypothetical protein
MENTLDNYYVYAFLDPEKPGQYIYEDFTFDYEPFYIGKGRNGRMISSLRIKYSNGFKKNKLISLKNKGLVPISIKVNENLTNTESLNIEIKLIKLIGRRDLNTGSLTNMTDGGEGRLCGKNSKESNEKIRLSLLKTNNEKRDKYGYCFKLNDDAKEKLRILNLGEKNPMFGKTHTVEVRENHSLLVTGVNHPMFGKKHSEETRQKIKDGMKRPRHNLDSHKKTVLQYSLDGIFIKEFPSIKAAFETGIPIATIGKICRGEIKNPSRFIFKFKEEKDFSLLSFYYKINDIIEIDSIKYILIKRTKFSVTVKNNLGELISFRKDDQPKFWQKKEIYI